MAYSFRHTDPRLTGVIIEENVSCGKRTCACKGHKRLHKGYFYLYWRDYLNGARLRKEYIRRNDVVRLKDRIRRAKMQDMEEKLCLRDFIGLCKEQIA
jgi:hypothetical protein